jgi:hypothetical protein
MENQKTDRRKFGVALFAGMMLAAPPLSLTAKAQTQTQPQRPAPRAQPQPPTVTSQARPPMNAALRSSTPKTR